MIKDIGIWIDLKKAYVIEGDNVAEIASNVEDFHIHGGSGNSSPYGEQEAVSESKLLERKKHQLTKYFKDIVEAVVDHQNIVVFGPAETKDHFLKMVKNKNLLAGKVLDVVSADSMTENKMKEFVRNYFNKVKSS